jgi:ligand-binding sensor domain-containing protein
MQLHSTIYNPARVWNPGGVCLANAIVFLWLLCSSILPSLAQPFMSRHFSANQGLPSSYCFVPLQSREGYLWVGTYGGVSRFDGNTFQNFTVNDGLVNNQVMSLHEDRRGRLWMGTFSGISIWQNGRFRNVTRVGKMLIERVFGFAESRDGRIWATCKQGLLVFPNADTTPVLYQFDNHNKPVQRLWNVCETPTGEILASNSYNLYRLVNNRFVEVLDETGQALPARALATINGQVFVGTFDQGLYAYQQGRVRPLYREVLPEKLGIFGVLTDAQKRLWLATNQGAFCLQNGKVIHLNADNQLPDNICLGICRDTEGNLWLTTPDGLVQCHERFIESFTAKEGLHNPAIYSMTLDPAGTVYFGGSSGPITAYRQGAFFQPFPYFQQTQREGSPIHFVRFDHRGQLWMSCDVDSVHVLRASRSAVVRSVGKFCLSFLETRQPDAIWIGGRSVLHRQQAGRWDTVPIPASMAVDDILALHQDRYHRIWVGTLGLRLLNGNHWTDLSRQTDTEGVFIQAIDTDAEGNLWVGTIGKGIRKISLNERGNIASVERITLREGLQNDSVLDLEFDDEGWLWVGSFGGVMRLDPNSPRPKGVYRTQLFNESSGILDNTWKVVSLLRGEAGQMWVGTAKGAMRFNIRQIPTNRTAPPVHIVSAQWQPNANDPANQDRTVTSNAELTHRQNSLQFQFAGISLNDPGGLRYTYLLEGLPQATWSSLSAQRNVTFGNLPPDTYTLRVKAVNAEGIESRAEARFVFTIRPPFWQTIWFRGLMALVLAGVVMGLVQFRIRFLNEKHQTALQLSEWKLKALQSQMNPHFIFNSLNSIQNYILGNQPLEGVKYLSRFSRLIRQILDNSNYQHMKLERVLETLRMYVEMEAMRFNHEFQYEFILNEADEDLLDVDLPPMLLQPFVENAIWHGLMPKQGDKQLRIEAIREQDHLLCVIDDNGVGRQQTPKQQGHISRGESITKSTFEAFNQHTGRESTLIIIDKTAPETGTRVEVRVPIG